jgi:hypothetical protein
MPVNSTIFGKPRDQKAVKSNRPRQLAAETGGAKLG